MSLPFRFPLYFLCAIVLVLVNVQSILASDKDLKLYQANAQQTIIDFKLNGFKLDTLAAKLASNKILLVPVFENGLSIAEKGAPNLPARVFMLGVPGGAQIEATVLPVRFEEMQNIEIAPAPEFQRNGDSFLPIYKLDERIFGQNAFHPAAQVAVDPPSQFRQQTIVRVQFSPFQYNPVTKVLRVLQEARIVVRHNGGQVLPAAPRVISETEESFYRSLILNYDPARVFRAMGAAALTKISSPFAAATLYKFPVTQEGVYRITAQALAAKDLTNIASDQIRLYNNGGRELPRLLSKPRPAPAGLIENAIYVSDGGDGRFDGSDFILFYGRGVEGFAFDSTSGNASRYFNHFGFNNYYWLSVDPIDGTAPAKRMNVKTTPSPAGLAPVSTFQDKLFVEEELNVWLESDQTWFGHLFTNAGNTNTRRYRISLVDPVTEARDSLKIFVYAPTVDGVFGVAHRLSISFNGQDQGEYSYSGDSNRWQSRAIPLLGGSRNGENEILMTYNGQGDVARFYMDYFEFKYERQLRLPGPLLLFDGRRGAAPVAYRLDNVNPQDLWLFDVSDFSNVARLNSDAWQINGAQITFADETHARVPRRYLAATSAAFANIEAASIERDSPSNLRSNQNAADMIIITHDDFLSQAQRLESLRENWHNGDSNQKMTVEIVNVQDVFDEFSCGMYDPVALRDFLRHAYLNWQTRPTYVVLFGDGDYDPKNILVKTDKNWIPTYHTEDYNPLIENYRVTDSWFTYLVGGDNDKIMDMAIGRLPVRSLTEAQAYIDKLIKYETTPVFGPWRNTVVMIGDDEFGQGGVPAGNENAHITDTEILVNQHTPKYFDIKKVYLTEYASVQSASISGIRKPTANEAILRLLNNGALIVNYTGHGNPNVWTHERVLEVSTDLDRIQNGDRQALWVAATCTFGKFDMPERQSFGEQLLLLPQRGAIAMFATTRDVFSHYNAALNQALYQNLFKTGQISTPLGLAHVQARAQLANAFVVNDEKFHLYGDPSMRLAIPRYSAELSTPDTIKALAVTRVHGVVQRDGQIASNFNGKVRLEAFDTEHQVNYRNGFIEIRYSLPGNSIFRGEATVANGQFELQFIAPKDITYGGTRGRLGAYFWNDSTDGNGYRANLRIGSTATSLVDRQGPEIQIGFAGVQDFASGGYVGLNPVLEVAMHDTLSGINLAGEIGHNITLELNGNAGEKIDATDLFNYNAGSYTRGSLRYVLENLSEGRHTLEVKAWDNFNNSNSASAEFVVVGQEDLRLFNVLNYPNPLRNNTSFTFELNQPNAEVEIKIYTLAGRLIRKLEMEPTEVIAGFNMLAWDGYDADGDRPANGVYLYKISARRPSSENGETLRTEEIGKLVIQR